MVRFVWLVSLALAAVLVSDVVSVAVGGVEASERVLDKVAVLDPPDILLPPKLVIPIYPIDEDNVCIPVKKVLTDLKKLKQMEVRLDNYGKWRGLNKKFLDKNGSYFRMPDGKKRLINLPTTEEEKIPLFPLSVKEYYEGYLDDIRTDDVSIDIVNLGGEAHVLVTIDSETKGTEFRLGCADRKKKKPCSNSKQKYTGQMKKIVTRIYMKIDTDPKDGYEGLLTYSSVDFDYNINLDPWIVTNTDLILGGGLAAFTAKIKKAMEVVLISQIKKLTFQKLVMKKLNQRILKELNKYYLKRALSLNYPKTPKAKDVDKWIKSSLRIKKWYYSRRGYLCMTTSYRKWIDHRYVKLISFTPDQGTVAKFCPFSFPFTAKLSVAGPVSIDARIDFSDGASSETVKWRYLLGGTVSESISHVIKGGPFSEKSLYSQLVLEYKGIFGNTFTILSPNLGALIRVKCLGLVAVPKI
uniref:Uncharacterized protein n=1 Tax=Rhodosorus marinus TaxID=101924 RepID=A0A7S3EMN3_9RHOD|mmetsp:Transcript_45404/g.176518  ORF Transcript_45404/g.176518 Transcript_45404/m.176518 type:complete len:467 (+) Transcript_45404:69-1469(+)